MSQWSLCEIIGDEHHYMHIVHCKYDCMDNVHCRWRDVKVWSDNAMKIQAAWAVDLTRSRSHITLTVDLLEQVKHLELVPSKSWLINLFQFLGIIIEGWQPCTMYMDCSETCVQAYMARYGTWCTEGRTPICEDYAKIHNGGPTGCRLSLPDYWAKVKACCDSTPGGCD